MKRLALLVLIALAGCAPRVGGLTPEQVDYLGKWCELGCYVSTSGPIIIFIPDAVVQAAEDAANGLQRQ